MLQHEIEPFADANIAELRKAKNLLKTIRLLSTPAGFEELRPEPPTIEDMDAAIAQIESAQHAIYRFRQCALDEWKQKERYRTYAKEHGYPFS